MCIRDRYQRRVREKRREEKRREMQRKEVLSLLLLVVASFLVCGVVNGFTVEEIKAMRPNPIDLRQLPDQDQLESEVLVYTGYLPVNDSLDNALFYLFSPSLNNPATDPLLVWMNGGPGASSLLGCFIENGPALISGNTSYPKLVINPYSWTNNASVIFIDNPVGTGYSYAASFDNIPQTETQVAGDLLSAFEVFFVMFEEYQTNPFFITGESYAGKYIPSFATAIYENNLRGGNYINLVGIAIGDGWVHPIVQNQAYVQYPYNLGLIDSYQMAEAQKIADELTMHILNEDWKRANQLSNKLEAYVTNHAGVDEDNVLYSTDPIMPYAEILNVFLNSDYVKEEFKVGNHNWTFESQEVYRAFDNDEQQSVLYLLPNLIENYRVLIYTGNMDLNCNLLGVEGYLAELEWPDYINFYNSQQFKWRVDKSDLAGYAKNYGNFTTVIVRNSGHEVPFFQPKNSLDMINRFIYGIPF
eukprot:TRINITY_DN5740_c0_g1_i3.p1 TRINITY_DN5740_c0_g1~~TRINITY_DN5740_c0_g1_i3.p1  ORF type:complete len:472 (+),score=127.60 TRINITY_DN5740_c0_g1_i3:47-1462(+)